VPTTGEVLHIRLRKGSAATAGVLRFVDELIARVQHAGRERHQAAARRQRVLEQQARRRPRPGKIYEEIVGSLEERRESLRSQASSPRSSLRATAPAVEGMVEIDLSRIELRPESEPPAERPLES
jgi:hypothetical protein